MALSLVEAGDAARNASKVDAPHPIRKRPSEASKRRRSSLVLFLEAGFLSARSTFDSIKDFVAQTGTIALVTAVLPLIVIVGLRLYGEDIGNTYYGEDRTLIPPVWKEGNITAVPYALYNRWEYVVPPPGAGSLSPWKTWWNWTIATSIYIMTLSRVLTLRKMSVGSKMVAFIAAMVMILYHGSLSHKLYERYVATGTLSDEEGTFTLLFVILIAIADPLIFSTSYIFSEGLAGVRKGVKVALILFAVGIIESVGINLVHYTILPIFFDRATDNLTRALIRLGTPLIMKGFFLEWYSWLAPRLSNMLETDLHSVSVALYAPMSCGIDLIGRLMQSSGKMLLGGGPKIPINPSYPNSHSQPPPLSSRTASSIAESLVFELCGTLAEVWTADVLLQGTTTGRYCLALCGLASSNANNKVHSEEGLGRNDSRMRTTLSQTFNQESTADKKAHQTTIFCATAMIINTITEASGLIVGSLFWICCNANPSAAGGGGIHLSQAMVNFVIMLFGEVRLDKERAVGGRKRRLPHATPPL